MSGKFFTPSAGVADFTEGSNGAVTTDGRGDEGLEIDEFISPAALAVRLADVSVIFCGEGSRVGCPGCRGGVNSGPAVAITEGMKRGEVIIMGCRHWLPFPGRKQERGASKCPLKMFNNGLSA